MLINCGCAPVLGGSITIASNLFNSKKVSGLFFKFLVTALILLPNPCSLAAELIAIIASLLIS